MKEQTLIRPRAISIILMVAKRARAIFPSGKITVRWEVNGYHCTATCDDKGSRCMVTDPIGRDSCYDGDGNYVSLPLPAAQPWQPHGLPTAAEAHAAAH